VAGAAYDVVGAAYVLVAAYDVVGAAYVIGAEARYDLVIGAE